MDSLKTKPILIQFEPEGALKIKPSSIYSQGVLQQSSYFFEEEKKEEEKKQPILTSKKEPSISEPKSTPPPQIKKMNGLLENLAKTNAQQIEDRDLKTDELLLDSKFDGNNAPDLGKMMSTKEVFGIGTSKTNIPSKANVIPFQPSAESNSSIFGVNSTQSKPIDESKQQKDIKVEDEPKIIIPKVPDSKEVKVETKQTLLPTASLFGGGQPTEKKVEVGDPKSLFGDNKNTLPVKQTTLFGGGGISSGVSMFA